MQYNKDEKGNYNLANKKTIDFWGRALKEPLLP